MKLHMQSVLKAGGGAAVAAIVLGIFTSILSSIPAIGGLLGCLLAPVYLLASLVMPIMAGMAYGYFAPGKENQVEGIVGGILTGGFAGLLYGFLGNITVGFGTAILMALSFGFGGILFGALGGFVWPHVQDYVEG